MDLMTDKTFECRCCGSIGQNLETMGSPQPPRRIGLKSGDDVARYVSQMENGYSMRILGEGRAVELEMLHHLIALNENKDRINICVLMKKPGATEAVGVVEGNVFPSDDEGLSNQWDVRIVRWEDLMWQVLSFNEDKLKEVAKLFLRCGFRIADGIPTMIVGDETRYFPIRTNKTYTLENMPSEQAVDVEIEGNTEQTPPYPEEET